MKEGNILVADTSTKAGSVALFKGTALKGEVFSHSDKTHSERILNYIDWILENSGLGIGDIDLFISSVGPGSFTGIRIGLSLLKGFAITFNKPLVGVSSLDALAMEYKSEGEFLTYIEGRAGEIFYARYRKSNDKIEKISDYSVGDYSIIEKYKKKCIFSESNLFAHNYAYAYFLMKDNVFTGDITPLYIKKSDAELNYKRRISKNAGKVSN